MIPLLGEEMEIGLSFFKKKNRPGYNDWEKSCLYMTWYTFTFVQMGLKGSGKVSKELRCPITYVILFETCTYSFTHGYLCLWHSFQLLLILNSIYYAIAYCCIVVSSIYPLQSISFLQLSGWLSCVKVSLLYVSFSIYFVVLQSACSAPSLWHTYTLDM